MLQCSCPCCERPLLLVVALPCASVPRYRGQAGDGLVPASGLSHGFLIPFFAAFLLWDNRRELQGTAIAPSWRGRGWCLRLFVLLLASSCGPVPAAHFVVLLAAGLVWTLLGRQMLGR